MPQSFDDFMKTGGSSSRSLPTFDDFTKNNWNNRASEQAQSDNAQMAEASKVSDYLDLTKTSRDMEAKDQQEGYFRQQVADREALQQQKAQDTDSAFRMEQRQTLPSRDLPVIGPVLKFADWVASNPISESLGEHTQPDQPMLSTRMPGESFFRDDNLQGITARENFLNNSGQEAATGASKFIGQAAAPFFVPGAGLGTGSSVRNAADNLTSRMGQGLGQSVAREAAIGGTVGFGSEYAQGQGDLEQAAITGAAGAVLGGAFPLLGRGIQAASRSAGRTLAGAEVNPSMGVAGQDLLRNIDNYKFNTEIPSGRTAENPLYSPTDNSRFVQGFDDTLGTTTPGRDLIAEPVNLRDTKPLTTPRDATVNQNELRFAQPVRTSENAPQEFTRGNYKNQLNNGNFSEELQRGIRNTDQSYDRITNADSLAAANENVKNLSAAESKFLLNESGGPDHIATGYRLMQELDATGEHARALVVSNKLAKDLTKSGQTSQAAAILERLSPEGQLLNLVRTAEKNGKTVSVADSIKFKELAAKVQEKSGAGIRANQFNGILNQLEKGDNVGVDDIKKLSDYLSGANKVVKQKAEVLPIRDDLPKEFKDTRKRDKIVSYLDDVEQSALARIASRKNNLNSLPLPEWKDHTIVVAAQIAKGTIKAATHVEDLVKMFGEEIRPVATQVFQSAQSMIKGVSGHAGEGNLERANEALRRVTGQAQAEKEIVLETASHVKKLIADAKSGKLDPADVQKLRDYSDEIAAMTADKPKRIPTQEEKFLQSVKSLAKKIAQVENEKIPADQANREVSSLLRQITKIGDEGISPLARQPIDNKALSDIAHDVMEKTRPNPKPTTLQEKIVEKYIKDNKNVSPGDIDTLRELAKNVTRLSGDQRIDADIAMQKILNSYEKSSIWDKTLAIRYMSMLMNTSTQAVNTLSGPIMSTTGVVADVLGTMIDIVMSKALKQPRTTTLYGTNPLQFMARYLKNLKTGAKAGAMGVNPAGIQGTNEIRGLAFKSLYNPLGLAERALGAVAKGPDFATYKSVFDAEMIKQARVDAINKKIKGRSDVQNHIQQFINDPPEAAILQADRIGKNTTFQRSDTTGGKLANFLNSSPNVVKPAVNAIFPFVRTPVNIASTAVTMTPAGIIKGLYQMTSKSDASQREAIRTLSMGLTGSGIGALGYYLSQIGVITGANDSGDKEVDSIREQAGKGKYRFNTSALMRYLESMFNGEGDAAAAKAAQYQKDDKQFDYNKLQPLALSGAIGASLQENKDKPIAERIGKAGEDAFGSLFGMSTLKGVQDVFQPQYGGTVGEKALGVPSRIAESFFKSFSPGGLAQEARRQDPIVRKTPFNNGIIEDSKGYFKSRTPGLSQSLPPSKTTLGQSKLNAPGITGQYLNPYKSEVAPYNEAAAIISQLIDRTGDKTLAPSAPDKKVEGKDRTGKQVSIALSQDRYAKLQEDVGQGIIKAVLALPNNLSDQKRAEKIKDIYSKVKETERNKVKRENGIRIN